MAEAGVARTERRQRTRELLEYVGLAGTDRPPASELSGGEMQRVAIARALANRPRLLLADEPTGELDQATGEQIISLIDRLNSDGMVVVVVTHNLAIRQVAEAAAHARRPHPGGDGPMIVRLALRSLVSKPIRSAVLAGGFGLGRAVMAALLGIGSVILDQARAPALVGGGDVIVGSATGRLTTPKFVLADVLSQVYWDGESKLPRPTRVPIST